MNNTTCNVSIKDSKYTVKFPNVGQLMEIEGKKMALSNGTYGLLVAAKSVESNRALDLIDSLAVYSTMIPELAVDLKIKVYTEMPVLEGLLIIKSYTEQYYPWYSAIMEGINETVGKLSVELKELQENAK